MPALEARCKLGASTPTLRRMVAGNMERKYLVGSGSPERHSAMLPKRGYYEHKNTKYPAAAAWFGTLHS